MDFGHQTVLQQILNLRQQDNILMRIQEIQGKGKGIVMMISYSMAFPQFKTEICFAIK